MDCQRHHFFIPDDEHYLNCAYMSPLARAVTEAGRRGIERKQEPWRITARDFFEDGDRLRALFATLVDAPDPRRIAILPSASYGIATAMRNIPLAAGQNIVITQEQFPSNVYAWRRACGQAGAELRVVGPPGHGPRGEQWNARLLEAIDARTAVVALGHVHWTDGTRFDLEAIGHRARARGAALVVDGTQSVGALPFSVRDLQPDALVCAGYKWLMGPYSIGLAYFAERFDEGVPLEENWIARLASEDFRGLVRYRDEYQPGALRYDVGERSNFILVPMLLAALDLVLAWGPPQVQAYCAALTRDALVEAAALGFDVEDARWRAAHLFGLRVPAGVNLERLATELAAAHVSASLRGSALRVSPHVYNTAEDVRALLDVLRAAAG